MDINAKVQQTVQSYQMISQDDSILVALSGGPDSVALLHLLVSLRTEYNLKITAVYLNHQLRKKAAQLEEKFCQQLCDSLDIELDLVEEDIRALAKENRQSIEEAARHFRYGLFEALALEDNHNRIALGHHRDDRTETILFRLIRGTGPHGLKGLPAVRGKIIRPLYDLTKTQILDFLNKHKFEFCQDRSNESLKMSRNYIRNKLLPDIRDRLNPQVDKALINLAELTEVDQAYLATVAGQAVKRVVKRSPGGKFQLDLSRLSSYDGAVQSRLLRHCLIELFAVGLAPDRQVLDRLADLVKRKHGKLTLPSRIMAEVSSGRLYLYRLEKRSFEQPLEAGKSSILAWPAVTFRVKTKSGTLADLIVKPKSQKVSIDYDTVCWPVKVRNRIPGDLFRPLGMKGYKKISDLLSGNKVPEVLRDEVCVVTDRKGIIWVAGIQIDDRVKLTKQTRKVMFIEFSRRKKS